MTKIQITIGKNVFEAELNDTPTGKAIIESLPFESSSNTWGMKFIFLFQPIQHWSWGAKAEVLVGELAYWPSMPAFCIFFGPIPVSSGSQPVAASAVNVFGKLDSVNLEKLVSIVGGEKITVELIQP